MFVGAFNTDYAMLVDKDPKLLPQNRATGLGVAMLSNRISHWFDLKGPSITLDTACSASSAALHLACDTLRTSVSKLSVVSGVNIMLTPDPMLALSSLKYAYSRISRDVFS